MFQIAINTLCTGILSQSLEKQQGKSNVTSLHFSYLVIKHRTGSWAIVFTTNK